MAHRPGGSSGLLPLATALAKEPSPPGVPGGEDGFHLDDSAKLFDCVCAMASAISILGKQVDLTVRRDEQVEILELTTALQLELRRASRGTPKFLSTTLPRTR